MAHGVVTFQVNEIFPLGCSTIVLRALAVSGWIQNLHEAFLLRASDRSTGLSVSYSCPPSECRSALKTSHGVISLHVGRVRELRLDVVPDEPTHANIKGLPYKEDGLQEAALAERFASLLAQQARFVEKGKQVRPEK